MKRQIYLSTSNIIVNIVSRTTYHKNNLYTANHSSHNLSVTYMHIINHFVAITYICTCRSVTINLSI